MSFGQSIKTCLSKYVTFAGRASRSEFWWFVLFWFLVLLVTGILDQLLGLTIQSDATTWTVNGQEYVVSSYYNVGWLELIALLALFLPALSVQVRRLHDRDASGWWWWLNLLNCLCGLGTLILIFAFYIQPSTPGDNRYGPPPTPTTA